MKPLLKKFLVISLLLLTLFAPLSVHDGYQIQKNEAKAIGVFVTGGKLDYIVSIPSLQIPADATAFNTAQIAGQQKIEYIEGFALASLKRQLINRIVDDIIVWINGGGAPRFVTDWEGFLGQAAGEAVGAVVQDLGLGFLCSPFSAQLQITVAGHRRFTDVINCTLDDIVSNIENFYYDFSSGGWIAFHEAWEPQNNFFGSFVITTEEVNRRAFESRQAAQNEALAGGGILSTRTCKESGPNIPASGPDIDGDGIYGDYDCEITTPGSVIQDLLGKALTVDIDLILESEQLPDYVADIANALVNRLIREGVNGLRGLSARTNPGNDFVPPNIPGSICDGLEGELLTSCLSYQGIISVSFENSRQQLIDDIDASIVSRNTAIATMQTTKTLWEEHLAELEEELKKASPCEEAENFRDTVGGEIELINIQVQTERSNVAQLESAKAQAQAIEFNAWDQLVQLEISLAGISNPSAAEAVEDRTANEQETAKQTIENQEETCSLS